jgi:hypothetical protein
MGRTRASSHILLPATEVWSGSFSQPVVVYTDYIVLCYSSGMSCRGVKRVATHEFRERAVAATLRLCRTQAATSLQENAKAGYAH